MIGLLAAADTLVLFVAASLTKPLQPVLDAFTAQTGIVIQRESGASLEHVRKITDLHRIPDVLLLADADVFPRYLVPAHATWYADFARNRMVVAYTPKSKHAGEITPENWTSILQRSDVEIGRTDPSIAPVGYRTLLMFQLAERFYRKPNLAASLLEHSPNRNIRPNAAELAALLAAGELDYIYDYQSVAESNGFGYVALPPDDRPWRRPTREGIRERVRAGARRFTRHDDNGARRAHSLWNDGPAGRAAPGERQPIRGLSVLGRRAEATARRARGHDRQSCRARDGSSREPPRWRQPLASEGRRRPPRVARSWRGVR